MAARDAFPAIRKRPFCALSVRFLFAFTAGDVLKPFKFRVESAGHCSPSAKNKESTGLIIYRARECGRERVPHRFSLKTNSAGASYCVIGPGIWKSSSPAIFRLAPLLNAAVVRACLSFERILILRNLIGRVCSSVLRFKRRNGFKIFQSSLRVLLSFLKLSAKYFATRSNSSIIWSVRAICDWRTTI